MDRGIFELTQDVHQKGHIGDKLGAQGGQRRESFAIQQDMVCSDIPEEEPVHEVCQIYQTAWFFCEIGMHGHFRLFKVITMGSIPLYIFF